MRDIPIIDLFAGPGGLGEGFSAGILGPGQRFTIRLSIEKDIGAHRTLTLRAFLRHFQGRPPRDYYTYLRGKISRDELFQRHPSSARQANVSTWLAELGPALDPTELRRRIRKALDGQDQWVLIGGPPCQAYSIAGRSRNKGKKDYSPERDTRHYLYREYLKILSEFQPPIFLMENVKGVLSATVKDELIFQRILEDLTSPATAATATARRKRALGYRLLPLVTRHRQLNAFPDLSDFVIRSEEHGVPQTRHRVFVLGVREDIPVPTRPQLPHCAPVFTGHVIGRLPRLRSGLSGSSDSADAWIASLNEISSQRWYPLLKSTSGPKVHALVSQALSNLEIPPYDRGREFIECEAPSSYAPDWYTDDNLGGVCNHVSRDHMANDLHRYLFAACFAATTERSPTLAEFPPDLLPEHSSVAAALASRGNFADRFRVQVFRKPASTITSHISKDGHYYIHPDPTQCRSLTVREAARLQTFPDNYYFEGPRTSQYTQVGNAVPPLLAKSIADVVGKLLTNS